MCWLLRCASASPEKIRVVNICHMKRYFRALSRAVRFYFFILRFCLLMRSAEHVDNDWTHKHVPARWASHHQLSVSTVAGQRKSLS